MAKEIIKIFVSSTVYGFENEIQQICTSINSYSSSNLEYRVLNSHIGSIPPIPGKSPTFSCLKAVEDCHYFLGIILPRYGSGITHLEFNQAINSNKPRGYLSHFTVRIARDLLAQYMYIDIKERKKNPDFVFRPTPVFQDSRIIDMYNEAIGDGKSMEERMWAQEFGHSSGDALVFIDSLFSDIERFKIDLENINRKENE